MHHLPYINDTMINNINYVFILRDVQDINRRRIYEQFKKYLKIEYSVFNSLLNDYTDNYNILVLDIKSNSEYLEDRLFWYKASIHNNFRICNEESWIYNKNNYINEPPKRELNRHVFY